MSSRDVLQVKTMVLHVGDCDMTARVVLSYLCLASAIEEDSGTVHLVSHELALPLGLEKYAEETDLVTKDTLTGLEDADYIEISSDKENVYNITLCEKAIKVREDMKKQDDYKDFI